MEPVRTEAERGPATCVTWEPGEAVRFSEPLLPYIENGGR